MKLILLVCVLCLLLISCGPVKSIGSSPFADYGKHIDDSVKCPGTEPELDDIYMDKSGDVLKVETNFQKKPNLYMNAIVSKQVDFSDNSIYVLSGEWRKPEDAENEQFDVNLQLVINYIEYHAEILWDQNSQSPLYEWVWTRGQDLNAPIKLMKVKDDFSWHKFRMEVHYDGETKILKSIEVDKNRVEVNIELGTIPKDYETAFGILLETTNRYTGCSWLLSFVGKSEWRNIELKTVN